MANESPFGSYSIVDDECILCASCSSLAPDNFAVDLARAYVISQPESEEQRDQCEAARLNCPAASILLANR